MKKFEMAALIFVVVVIFAWVIAMIVAPDSFMGNLPHAGKATEMARYLNEKYGYAVTQAHCVYFREEDYSYHSGFLTGRTFDIPYIGIFEYDGKYITVTDRKGFMGDDHQLDEVNNLVCGYFEDLLGIRPKHVEIFDGFSYNRVLFYHYNEKLTDENIDDFMQCIWTNAPEPIRFVFYFDAQEDLDQQVEQVTKQLCSLKSFDCISEVAFYITDMEELEVLHLDATVHLQEAYRNDDEDDIGYICRNSHVVNPVEHHYTVGSISGEAIEEKGLYNNQFLVGGGCSFGKGSRGYGSREIRKINSFSVFDMDDDELQEQLTQMVSYGKFREFTILFSAGEEEIPTDITIVDGDKYRWEFRWERSPMKIYAYSHGYLQELEVVYECGELLPEHMDAILEKHKAHYEEQYAKEHE